MSYELLCFEHYSDANRYLAEHDGFRVHSFKVYDGSLSVMLLLERDETPNAALIEPVKTAEPTPLACAYDTKNPDDLAVRSYNCLMRAGIKTVEQLCAKTRKDLMRVRNMGNKSLNDIDRYLATKELVLKGKTLVLKGKTNV